MAEIAKPDYLSLVNKGGSGFNVSELVTSLVASEIEPKRILQTSKLEKTENAISGIGYLNSQSATTQSNFSTISSDSFFEITASNSTSVQVTATDETKLSNSNRTISEVSIAKEMVFELGSFSDLATTFTANLTIDFGSWTQTSSQSDTAVALYETGKTYVANSAITDAADKTALTNDTDWPGVGDVAEDEIFTASSDASAPLNSGSVISKIDAYEFMDADAASTETISFTDETIVQVAARLNSISGLSAQIIDTNGDGSSYSLIVSSADTGADNGFKITEVSSSVTGRWATTAIPSSDTINNNFSQLARDASFKLDGIAVSRSTNSITDLIDGAEVTLKADLTGSAVVAFSRSEAAIRQNIRDTIFSLNEFKTEIDRLTYIDVDGDANGPLALETSATLLKSKFKKLAVAPLEGYGSENIYLSQLGIKTNSAGEYYFDEATFLKTFTNNPEYFNALKEPNLTTNTSSVSAEKSQFTSIDPGTYSITGVDLPDGGGGTTKYWFMGTTLLNATSTSAGGIEFTNDEYPGLVITSTQAEPSDFNLFVGKSFAQKVIDMMSEVLDSGSTISSAEQSYKDLTIDIQGRLDKLEERESLIKDRYTAQFASMEKDMTQFNSTKSLLENFVDSWNQNK